MRSERGEGIWRQESWLLLVVEEVSVANMDAGNVQLEMKLVKLADAGVSLLACFSSPASRACSISM
jgi:hypothetical protein